VNVYKVRSVEVTDIEDCTAVDERGEALSKLGYSGAGIDFSDVQQGGFLCSSPV
jgi:hypothetical protein